jgi:hypothetical protein
MLFKQGENEKNNRNYVPNDYGHRVTTVTRYVYTKIG